MVKKFGEPVDTRTVWDLQKEVGRLQAALVRAEEKIQELEDEVYEGNCRIHHLETELKIAEDRMDDMAEEIS